MAWRDDYLKKELGSDMADNLIKEQAELIRLYSLYDGPGQRWEISGDLDYTPSRRIINNIKYLIKEVARFMFSRAPEITIFPVNDNPGNAEKCAALESFIRETLQKSGWVGKLSKAGRDQMIAGRVLLKVTGGPNRPLRVHFRPAIEGWALHNPEDVAELEKLIYLYQTKESSMPDEQRFWVQIYRMDNGAVLVNEKVVDGRGTVLENRLESAALPIPYIPAYVLINDGLTGDTKGESDAKELEDLALSYNRMMSDDEDALRFNMFPQTVFKDASEDSLKNIKVAPHAIIDVQTEPTRPDGQADVKVLESGFGYNDRIENHLNRIDADMRKLMGVPPKSLDEYKSSGISGKALFALYWALISKCEERWTEWDSALIWLVKCLHDLAVAYGQGAAFDGAEYIVRIEHLYPITEDEEEERMRDLREVSQGVRSIKSYIEKWRPDINSEEELKQIVHEKRILEEQFF